jgi:Flp pilus assembly protein TadD
MFAQLRRPDRFARFGVSIAASAILVLGLCSCQTASDLDITGALGDKTEASRSADLGRASDPGRANDPRRDVDTYRERFRANPKDPDLALQYGKALRATGQKAQAVAVLEKATLDNPGNRALLGGYGRALADNGNFQQAFDVLSRAHSPVDPDWRILSAQGSTLDQLGRHDEARQYYASALKIVPDEPGVLSNLGLSYLLSKDLPKAEETLRRADSQKDADPRVRLNLALVVGLQGRMSEAESLVKTDRSPDEAKANVAYLRRLLARPENAQAAMDKKLPVDTGQGN